MRSSWRALVLLLACSSREPERGDNKAVAPMPAPAPRAVEIPEPAVALPRELAFELLEPGSGNHEPLRYAPVAGTGNVVTRTELASRELENGTWRDAPKAPPTTSELAFAIESSGRVTLGTGSAPLAITIDARGRVGDLVDHAGSAEELVQRVLAMAVPLPDEPIGKGAKWRVITAFRQQGAVLKQTATYTLTSRGARWKIAVDIQRLAEQQRVGDVEIVAIVRRLQGTFEIDPAVPFPRVATLAVQSSVHARSGGRENIVEDAGTVELRSASSSGR